MTPLLYKVLLSGLLLGFVTGGIYGIVIVILYDYLTRG